MVRTAPSSKGTRTRERLVATVAAIFNRRGYAGTSIDDVMRASGLTKGGIYRHFNSKDALAISAFDYAVSTHAARIREHLGTLERADDRLLAVVRALASVANDSPLPGGCPIMNMAVECDDGAGPLYTRLRTRARRAMSNLINQVAEIIQDGVSNGELRSNLNATDEATALIGSLEGALMLSKLYADPIYMHSAAQRAERHVNTLIAPRFRS